MTETFDDHGVRFEYPRDWEVEVTDDGSVTTVSLQAPNTPAFALVTLDESRPEPGDVANEVLDTMCEEYPGLDSSATNEKIRGYAAVGHDVEFLSLDMTNACAIRCFRTERRTILIFGQWCDVEEEAALAALDAIRGSLEETDLDEEETS